MKICPIVNYSEKTYSVCVKPIAKTASGGWRLLTEPIANNYCFSQPDKTLVPGFLKILLDIGKENLSSLEKITKIKDMILKIMGYQHPEELKFIFVEKMNSLASYEPVLGKIVISEGKYSDKDVIKILRHELEHLHQFVRIYKAKGEQAFLDGMEYLFKKNHPNATEADILNLNLKANFNNDFYKIMQKDVSIEDFDAEKYYKSAREYIEFDSAPSKGYEYFNNQLEKDAYSAERKVLKAFGLAPIVSVDYFPQNYKTMLKLMNKAGIPEQYHDNIIQVLNITARLKDVETKENFKKYIKIWNNKSNKKEVSSEDLDWYYKVAEKLDAINKEGYTLETVQSAQKYYQQVEEWMREGKFDTVAISNDM